MSTFAISDPHLGHEKLALALRGMTAKENDELIISNWNRVVHKHDKVYILGDVTMDKPNIIRELIPKLNGFKEVILGNHDTPRCVKALIECGCKVSAYGEYKGWLLSHIPVDPSQLDKYHGNIHGHIHLPGTIEGLGKYDPPSPTPVEKYINVNCEFTNYTPIRLDELIAAHTDPEPEIEVPEINFENRKKLDAMHIEKRKLRYAVRRDGKYRAGRTFDTLSQAIKYALKFKCHIFVHGPNAEVKYMIDENGTKLKFK